MPPSKYGLATFPRHAALIDDELFAMPHATSEPSVPPAHSPYEPDVCSARFFCAFGSCTAMFATRPPESISA